MITIFKDNEKYCIYQDGEHLGTVELYENPYHTVNCYVKLNIKCLVPTISAELFAETKKIAARPLQAMVNSDDAEMIAFLVAGGFVCKRKCYEVEACADDYIGGSADIQLFRCSAGTPEHAFCCRLMYRHYTDTHKEINPWTAGYEAFCVALPATAVYAKCGNQIASLAFIEDNEIAYVCGTDKEHFLEFAKSLASFMFAQHECVFFESDDCDWAAMMLRSLFINQDDSSYDTYINAIEVAK